VFPSRVYHQIFNAIKIAKSSSVLFEIFFHNARNPSLKRTGYFTITELRDALQACIKIAQQDIYAHEISDLSKKGQFSSKSQLQPLHPFLDKGGYLAVGGRLQHSHLPYDSKRKLILPPSHHIIEMIIMNEHLRLLHAGPQLLSASLRQQYWIPRTKQVIRPVLHRCLPCFKLKAAASQQLMSVTFGKSNTVTSICKCRNRLCGSI